MRLRKWVALACATAVLYPMPNRAAAAEHDVLHDVHANFQRMRDTYENVLAYREAKKNLQAAEADLAEAKSELETAKQEKDTAVKDLSEAKKSLADAKAALAQSIKNLQEAQAEAEQKTAAAIASQQAAADFLPQLQAAQEQVEGLQGRVDELESLADQQSSVSTHVVHSGMSEEERAARIAAALDQIGYTQENLEAVERQFSEDDGASEETETEVSGSNMYQGQIDTANANLETAENELDDLNDQFEELLDARSEAEEEEAEARQTVQDAVADKASGEKDVQEAEQTLKEADQASVESELNLKTSDAAVQDAQKEYKAATDAVTYFGENTSWQSGIEYYSWSGNINGHQWYVPYEFSSVDRHKNLDISLSTGYVHSNTGATNGSVSGWTDTTVNVSRLNAHPKYDVRYGLEINVPTGKAKMYNNAVVADDLARFTRFGEGWNWTPELTITRHLSEEDSLQLLSSYSLRGNYEYSMDTPDAKIYPGNVWTEDLSYLHAGANEKFLARVFFVNTGKTRENDLSYREGNDFGVEGYYQKKLTAQNALETYLGMDYTGATSYDTGLSEPNSGVHRQYFGIGLEHKLTAKRTLRVMGNYMRSDGYTYNPLRNTYSYNRHKLSLLLGYEQSLNEKENIAVYLERYRLYGENETNYHGWGMNIYFSRSL